MTVLDFFEVMGLTRLLDFGATVVLMFVEGSWHPMFVHWERFVFGGR